MNKKNFLERIKGQLIVSCQALPNEPLHGSDYMAKMAQAAKVGGAACIRANGVEDIKAIKQVTQLPIVGLIKQDYKNSPVYITPTKTEIQLLIDAGADVIALDATTQDRPNHESLEELIRYIRINSQCLIMGDISTFDEGIAAVEAGVDLVSTTLSSYTPYTKDRVIPDLPLIEELAKATTTPIIAEGNIKTPAEAARAIELGAHAVVVGTAITRPQIVTKQFCDEIKKTTDRLLQSKQ
ncbi:N-acetylmannosamine-6-phosphate 2-epimerase [Anaerobacillus isosaccharinicus]|uniref:Putative N-acetylmannosamine-6-phosphate 2-epimerase n=1 Tax=Anaerobacillus isosaccharinicus TaxID=1532552 RepID=A0A7S7LA12_9BACI|nr:N-acetylmannosamine-6-phosphate 2-epimerase [Anaerobacillus isosaccharinicus]MBA5584474.1 N-acetylmannosamine-6-phosphate 2-epimerase [Anaerobacillus isosaccharinicus]QOY37140.1 N-acetylmannosamine-6-phosphate 2-epimerase [Anaerobacillus isosaccharinicus]